MRPARKTSNRWLKLLGLAGVLALPAVAHSQLIDRTLTPNAANEGVAKSLAQQIGAGRGNVNTVDSSIYIIKRDPARSVRRGRQLFQRKFSVFQGLGPRTSDGVGGNIARRCQPGRRPGRLLRRLPRPAARLRRLRRRRRHPPRQPGRAPPVRARPAGDAGRRDHHRDPGPGGHRQDPVPADRSDPAGIPARPQRRDPGDRLDRLRPHHLHPGGQPAQRAVRGQHQRGARGECGPAGAAVLRPGGDDLDPRVPGGRLQRRDGAGSARSRPAGGIPGRGGDHPLGHGA